jgi:hypothetical protein
MDYIVVQTFDRWGYELRDSAGLYAGNALTLEQAQRFALAEGAKLRVLPAAARRGRAGIDGVLKGWLRGITGLWSARGRRLVPEVAS